MEQLVYRFTLDTHKNGVQRTLQGFLTGDNLSRRFIISLVENDLPYDLPLDNVVANMYIKRPSQSSPSIKSCLISCNNIIFDVEPEDVEELGTVECQLKLISGTLLNPERVLIAPLFNIEVWESITDDSVAEDTQEYGALEEAVIAARMAYDGRITEITFDDSLRPYVDDTKKRVSKEELKKIINGIGDIVIPYSVIPKELFALGILKDFNCEKEEQGKIKIVDFNRNLC